MTKYKLKMEYITDRWDHFFETINKYFFMEFKMVIFISPYELQIIFSFNFFVLKMFDYERSKRAIIHMDFIKHFSKYYNFQKLYPSKH
jgi:hypothetical protein